MLNNTEKTMEKIVALCKNRGFIFAGSDIYGGLANTWDYGPLGARMKNNVKDTWRKRFIQERRNSYEVDADILMHPKVWEASGHIASFSDPLLDCKECKMRHRADTLIENFDPDAHPDKMTKEEISQTPLEGLTLSLQPGRRHKVISIKVVSDAGVHLEAKLLCLLGDVNQHPVLDGLFPCVAENDVPFFGHLGILPLNY